MSAEIQTHHACVQRMAQFYAKHGVARGRTDGEALRGLHAAKVAWEHTLNNKGPQGRPAGHEAVYRIASSAVLLTYQSFTSLDQWRRFVNCVKANVPSWHVKHWCASLETCKSGRLHVHLMLQFWVKQGRSSGSFAFEGINPNVNAHDFYVFTKKLGTVVDEGGHECCMVQPRWCGHIQGTRQVARGS